MLLLLQLSGLFTLALGITHVFMPILFDFDGAIPRDGAPLRPFRLWFYTYATKRSDIRGIARVMNHSVSFVLISIGIADLVSPIWAGRPGSRILIFWIAVWWFLRAACQLYLGKRRGDWWILGWFSLLGVLHVLMWFRI